MGRPAGSKNKKVAASKKAAAVKDSFSILLHVNGLVLKGDGPTLLDALNALPKVVPKTKAVVTISRDGVMYKPIIYTIPLFQRLFYMGMTGEVQRAQLSKRYAT